MLSSKFICYSHESAPCIGLQILAPPLPAGKMHLIAWKCIQDQGAMLQQAGVGQQCRGVVHQGSCPLTALSSTLRRAAWAPSCPCTSAFWSTPVQWSSGGTARPLPQDPGNTLPPPNRCSPLRKLQASLPYPALRAEAFLTSAAEHLSLAAYRKK